MLGTKVKQYLFAINVITRIIQKKEEGKVRIMGTEDGQPTVSTIGNFTTRIPEQ